MQTKPFSLQSPEAIAKEYGGNKQSIARAAQMGLVDPTAAVLAGMFIDRMRTAATQEQAPQQTVAQRVLSPQAQAPVGLGATPAAQQTPAPAQMGAAPAMADGGLASLPVSETMFPDEYAGGGVVAFSEGDVVRAAEGKYFPKFEELRPVGADAAVPGSGVSSFFKSLSTDQRRIDPETGEAVTLGEYLRRVDARRAAAARAVLPATPTAQPPAAAPAQPPLRDFKDTDTGVDLTGLRDSTKPPVVIPEGKSFKDFKKEMTDAGIAEDPLADIRAKIASMAGESKLDREFSKNMALAQAGFSIMGGTSPYALTNIGKGAMEGISQYGKDIKDIKAAEKDLFKMQTELAKADDARNRGDFKAWQDSTEKAKDYALKLRKLGVDERVADAQIKYYGRPGTYEELGQAAEKYPWLKERFTAGAETAEATRAKTALAAIENALLTMKKEDPKRKELERQRAAILERLTSMGGAGGGGGSSADPLGLRGGR